MRFQMVNDTDRFVAKWLSTVDVSSEGREVLDKARHVYTVFFDNLHNMLTHTWKIENWDSGWYQIRQCLKEHNLAMTELGDLHHANQNLADKILPQIMEYGFLEADEVFDKSLLGASRDQPSNTPKTTNTMRLRCALRNTPPFLKASLWLVVLCCGSTVMHSQGLSETIFQSSNLPIVLIDTQGQTILDEPRIPAKMKVVDNQDGDRNFLDSEAFTYDGNIEIEIRGSSSQAFEKKQYRIETQHPDGSNNTVSLLGLPEENDWILGAPTMDRAMIRNSLAYHISRELGEYAPRTSLRAFDQRGIHGSLCPHGKTQAR